MTDAGSRADEASGNDIGSEASKVSEQKSDFERDLGVVEAITVVTRSCPNGGVVRAAEGALEAIKTGGSGVMKQQAYFVLTSIKGWRGDRASQVHRSLSRYLEQQSEASGAPEPAAR